MHTEQVKTNGHATHTPNLAILDVENVDANPNNPRKTFTAIDDLASSIVAHGLLEPIIVRPKGKRYELVCGERRWRASRKAKVKTILSLVRDLDDKQCEILMVEENTKRSDLHPLEEAEGYERLRKVHGMTVEEIAATVSKTVATVYARMKLCDLGKEGREAFYNGQIGIEIALAVARLPDKKTQAEALVQLRSLAEDLDESADQISFDLTDDKTHPISNVEADGAEKPDAVPTRAALAFIRGRYMLKLVDAPFDLKDAALVPAAGACTTCSKRTGNQKELFADIAGGDVCTDRPCFDTKAEAAWKRVEVKAKAVGQKVLSKTESARLFQYGHLQGGQTDYKEVSSEEKKKLGDDSPKLIVARAPDGTIHELVKKRAPGADERATERSKEKTKQLEDHRKKDEAKRAIEKKTRQLALAAILEKDGKQPTVEFWRTVAFFIAVNSETDFQAIIEGRGVKGLTRYRDPKWTAGYLAKLNEKAVRSLIVEMIAEPSIEEGGWNGERTAFDMLCDFYKVDPKKFQTEAKTSVGAGAKS